MRNLLFMVFTFVLFSGFGQKATPSINDFQYVVVPTRYDFQRSPNQYRINTLVKHLLEKEGFQVFFEGEQPSELVKQPCKALQALLDDRSSLFSTKVVLSLKDCYGNVVFESTEAKSKIKDYEPSFHEAIRKTFDELAAQGYEFSPVVAEVSQGAVALPVQAGVPTAVVAAEVAEPAVVVPEGDAEEQVAQIVTLYAQETTDGFQLVDTTPAVVFRIKRTSRKNTFTIEGLEGLLYQNDKGDWTAEYYKNGVLVTEVYRIRF